MTAKERTIWKGRSKGIGRKRCALLRCVSMLMETSSFERLLRKILTDFHSDGSCRVFHKTWRAGKRSLRSCLRKCQRWSNLHDEQVFMRGLSRFYEKRERRCHRNVWKWRDCENRFFGVPRDITWKTTYVEMYVMPLLLHELLFDTGPRQRPRTKDLRLDTDKKGYGLQ